MVNGEVRQPIDFPVVWLIAALPLSGSIAGSLFLSSFWLL
jgi:hypothetical protein